MNDIETETQRVMAQFTRILIANNRDDWEEAKKNPPQRIRSEALLITTESKDANGFTGMES